MSRIVVHNYLPGMRRAEVPLRFRAVDCGGDCGCDFCKTNRDAVEDAPTLAQSAAGYRFPAKGRDHCKDCSMFVLAGNKCTLVMGFIEPLAVCDHFAKK